MNLYIKEENSIFYNLHKMFQILDFIFQINPEEKYGSFKDAPSFDNVKTCSGEDLNDFKEKSKIILSTMNDIFSGNKIIEILKDYKNKIKTSLEEKKSKIENDLKTENFEEIQNNFIEAFNKNANDLKKQIVDNIESISLNIKNNYDDFNKLINKFKDKKDSSIILFKSFICEKFNEKEKDIKKEINNIINDVVENSKNCINWKNSPSTYSYIRTWISSSKSLNKIIEKMIDYSCKEIESANKKLTTTINEYKMTIENELILEKDFIIGELENKIKEEEINIKSKNKEEYQEWENEKKLYEEKKKKWEEICREYRKLKDDIYSLIVEIKCS